MALEFEFEGMDAIIVGCDGIDGEVIIPRTVSIEGDDGGRHHIVRAIGDYAFSFCDDVRTILIPDTVVRIDSSAFSNCSNLCDIVVDERNEHYASLDGVLFSKDLKILIKYPEGKEGRYSIPNGVENLESLAFSRADGLTSISIPCSLKGDISISWCPNVISIDVDEGHESLSSMDGVLFNKGRTVLIRCPQGRSGHYTVPDGVHTIKDWAFSGCDLLVSVDIPEGTESIGEWAFNECHRLETISLPNGSRSIGNWAFSDCLSLSTIDIPESVRYIGNNAFSGCKSITSIKIPYGIVSILPHTFAACSGLKSVYLPDSIEFIKDDAFSDCIGLESVEIPASVTSIGRYAFKGCSRLESVVIPEGVEYIDDWAFSGCSNLVSIRIPGSVHSMGLWVFDECDGLKTVYMNSDVDYEFDESIDVFKSNL